MRGAEILHEIREVHTDGIIRTSRWSLDGGLPYDPHVRATIGAFRKPLNVQG